MTGIIGAMKIEIESILEKADIVSRREIGSTEYYTGTLSGEEITVACCGCGKVAAAMCAQTMILEFGVDRIINTGCAGGLVNSMNICDTVIATAVCQHDLDTSPLGDPIGLIPILNVTSIPCDEQIAELLEKSMESGQKIYKGIIATGDAFINSKDDAQRIASQFNAAACEMEAGAIGQVCACNGVPFGIIRTISDGGDDESDLSFEQFARIASQKAAEHTVRFLALLAEKDYSNIL